MMQWEDILFVIHRLGMDEKTDLYITDIDKLEKVHIPPFSPNLPVLITGIRSGGQLVQLSYILKEIYPADHEVIYLETEVDRPIQEKRRGSLPIKSIPDLVQSHPHRYQLFLYLSPLGDASSFAGFLEIIAHLRDPHGGCPWDLKQTHLTLRAHLLSETYEVLSALDSENDDAMAEELGDLLLQIILHAQIASERGAFNITNILERIYKKIVGRHPHVFGDLNLDDVRGVLRNWEKLKAIERGEKLEDGEARTKKGLLDGVPLALPALIQSQEYLERSERIGLAWKTWRELVTEIVMDLEEIDIEVEGERKGGVGHILFKTANLASIMQVDAESSLREINQEFRKRLAALESIATSQNKELCDLDDALKGTIY